MKLLDKSVTVGYNDIGKEGEGGADVEKIKFMRLWDLYGGLLTPTQREITDMYFNLDLTVSEIAEQKGISRQGVSDCLSQCRKELVSVEEKLGHEKLISEFSLDTSFRLTDIGRWAAAFAEAHPQFAQEVAQLNDIIDRDYGEEVKAAMLKKEQ